MIRGGCRKTGWASRLSSLLLALLTLPLECRTTWCSAWLTPGARRGLHPRTRIDARYQYLAGGVNTRRRSATSNPSGSFASAFVSESISAHEIPVLTYYQLLLEQVQATRLGERHAQHLLALRDRLAPRVELAWHLSVWGTREDPTYSKRSLAHIDQLAARSAAFYAALHARFDLVFNDLTDRDADYYRLVEGNPRTWWTAADFRRHDAYIAGFTRRTPSPWCSGSCRSATPTSTTPGATTGTTACSGGSRIPAGVTCAPRATRE